jgi:hypothetical protein
VTAIDDVVDLQIGSGTAELAAPFVAFENLESKETTLPPGCAVPHQGVGVALLLKSMAPQIGLEQKKETAVREDDRRYVETYA